MSIEGKSPVPLSSLAEHPRAITVGTVTAQYKVSSSLLQNFINRFNHLCFTYIQSPSFAFGNILVFQKQEPS